MLPSLRQVFLLLGLLLASLGPTIAEVPREPVLRIETASHLAPITRISSDAEGRWAVTSGEDKTARLWDLRNGQQVGVLRPPIGGDSLGALYAAAMSPDGKQVALGGNSAFTGQAHALYLFDRASGSLPAKSTLNGLEAPTTQLTWSADSQLVAVGLRQEGLRVFRRNLGFVGADPEYNDAIYGLAFARDGRLAAVSLDGFIRIYQMGRDGLQRVARQSLPGKAYSVAWSPTGDELLVGLQDTAQALVLRADTLAVARSLRVDGGGNLGRVAWSADGQTIFAAGSVAQRGRFPVFAFADRGRAPAREIGSFANMVSSLASHTGGLLAASAEPAWAAFDGRGAQRLNVGPQKLDFRDIGEAFKLSQDGGQVVFAPQMGGGAALRFDLAAGELAVASQAGDWRAPQVPARLENWRNSSAVSYQGRALELRPGEVARSAASLPDGKRFVLGSEWFVRLFKGDGSVQWATRMPGVAWGVNVSGDGRWVVAALGDGSIRWLRASDGAEQLALFVHADRERWIVWTPSGFYDTSMGGEGLVGWHVNRADNQAADFYSVGRFRERFYQPSVIQKLLPLGDEQQALLAHQAELALLEKMNAEPAAPTPAAPLQPAPTAGIALAAPAAVTARLPPIVELQSDRVMESEAEQVSVRYAVRSPVDAPVGEVKVRVNGKIEEGVKTRSTRFAEGAVFEAVVPVPPKDSEIVLIAENKYAKSDPLTVTVRRPLAPVGKAPYIEKYDTLYMLVVAVNKYPGQNALQLPVKDAEDFRRQMQRIANPPPGKPRLYERPAMKILMDEQATQENIREGLKWLRDNVKARDAGVVFLAGHGVSQDRSYHYIPYRPDNVGKAAQWISGEEIVNTLQNLPGRAMFFLDTCHAGALANQAKVAGTINQVEDERGVIVFASSTPKELAQETDEWGNGAFTKALIEGLRGEAEDSRDKLIYPSGLKRYVTRRVRDLTDNQQRPYVSDHGIDDPIAVVVK